MDTNFSSSLLTFTPKGGFYNTAEAQVQAIEQSYRNCLQEDRDLFALSTLLPGSAFAKGRINYHLLSNPGTPNVPMPFTSLYPVETSIMLYNLEHESIPRALKNLLMLVEGRINNARTRKLILCYLFDRDIQDLENIAIKYKQKLKRLIQHAFGKQNLSKILNGNQFLFTKYIGRYNPLSFDIVQFIFGIATIPSAKLALYGDLREAAKTQDISSFMAAAKQKVIPVEVLMGFRNTYKLDIPVADILESGKMSERQKIQLQSAAEREGAEVKVDYHKQDLYDLWKLYYHKLMAGEYPDDDLIDAIRRKGLTDKLDIDIGKTVVLMDMSRSMAGSKERLLHPQLTGITLIAKLPNLQKVIYCGGKVIPSKAQYQAVIPSGPTKLWRQLANAGEMKVDSIVVISDGYENCVKGAFEHVYNQIKDKFKIYHVNPVFAAEVSSGRKLAADLEPINIDDYRQFKTNLIFQLMQSDKEKVKRMLMAVLSGWKKLTVEEKRYLE